MSFRQQILKLLLNVAMAQMAIRLDYKIKYLI